MRAAAAASGSALDLVGYWEVVTVNGQDASACVPAVRCYGIALERQSSMRAGAMGNEGLAGLDANKAVVITGKLNWAGAFGTRFLPRATVRKIAGALKF